MPITFAVPQNYPIFATDQKRAFGTLLLSRLLKADLSQDCKENWLLINLFDLSHKRLVI